MRIGKTIATPLAIGLAVGWLVISGQPSQATAGPTGKASHSARACDYRLSHLRPGGFLNVRSGPGLGYRRIGKLKVADRRIAGTCRTTRHWVAVKTSKGRNGWASAHYLRHSRNPKVPSRPALACAYRVARVTPTGYLNVRSGPGLGHRRIGKLRPADRRIAGSCRTTRHWVAVKTSGDKAGWASHHYLRKIR